MRRLSLRAGALGTLLATLPFGVSAAMTLTAQDTTFAMKAAQAGMTEVKLAALAVQKSKNPAVLAFAREMNADHSKANAQLATIVKSKGLNLPSSVGPVNAKLMAELQTESGTAFDSVYLKSQLPAHKKVLALFVSEVASGKDDDLVAFARQTVPVIKSHIAMDKSDIAKVGAGGMSMTTSQ